MTHNIMIIGDAHFGVKSFSEPHLDYMKLFFLRTVPEIAKQKDVKEIRLLGDLFDNRNSITIKMLNEVHTIFKTLGTTLPDIKIKILLGNHDIFYHNRLDVNSNIILSDLPNVEIIDKPTEETINGKTILTMPWIIKGGEMEKEFETLCKNKYDLCLGHFDINGFEMVKNVVEEKGLDRNLFKNFKRVLSGHFHIRGRIGKISFVGSPFELTWNDKYDEKGVHILDLETDEIEFIPNTSSPRHIEIFLSNILAKKDENPFGDVFNNIIKLVIDENIKDNTLNKLISKLETYKPFNLS